MIRNIVSAGIFLIVIYFLAGCEKENIGNSDFSQIKILTQSVSENNHSVEISLTAWIDRPATEDIVFLWSTDDGTAVKGEDYVERIGQRAVIPAGETSTELRVEIIGDTLMEFTERFRLRLQGTGNNNGPSIQTEVIIQNDDYIKPVLGTDGFFTPLQYPGMSLAWHDEFDQDEIDTKIWNYDASNGFPVNCFKDTDEIGIYSGDAGHLKLVNGKLKITASIDPANGIYRTARIDSKDKLNVQYGRIEIRAKLAEGDGIATLFGLLGKELDVLGWPENGEIEIVKMAGRDAQAITSGLVFEKNGVRYVEKRYAVPGIYPRLPDQYHLYTILWEEDRILWLLDYTPYFEISRSDLAIDYIFNDPFFFTLKLAVGGSFAGMPADPSGFPASVEIDYIRVYTPGENKTG